MRHATVWTNQYFWTMIGMALFVFLNARGWVISNISGADMLALGGVVAAWVIFDELRDQREAQASR
jgi:hypothetical protein